MDTRDEQRLRTRMVSAETLAAECSKEARALEEHILGTSTDDGEEPQGAALLLIAARTQSELGSLRGKLKRLVEHVRIEATD